MTVKRLKAQGLGLGWKLGFGKCGSSMVYGFTNGLWCLRWRCLPSGSGQLVLEVGGVGVGGEGFSCQQQLAGGHGDGLQVGHHLRLILLRLQEKTERGEGTLK